MSWWQAETLEWDLKKFRFSATLAQKYWITNGAVHAKHIVVFAQLSVEGKSEGVHAVLVPIRDDKLKVMPGVTVEDMGYKVRKVEHIFFIPIFTRGASKSGTDFWACRVSPQRSIYM